VRRRSSSACVTPSFRDGASEAASEADLSRNPGRRDLLRIASGLAALAAAAFACRALAQDAWHLPGTPQVEAWLFRPDATSPFLALALAAWLLWHRRGALHAGGPSPALAAPLLSLSAASYLWSLQVRAEWLLLPALATSLWGLAAARAGTAGVHATLLPGLVLGLGMPLPAPIHAELVWALQRFTAEGAGLVLALLGRDVSVAGVLIRSGSHAFLVVEECSGLRGLTILLWASVAVRELFRAAGPRAAWVVALAPPLAIALNVLRVAWIATAGNPAVAADSHASQGVAVVAVGTGLLYATGWWIGRRSANEPAEPTPHDPAPAVPGARLALGFWGVLAALSLLPREAPEPAPVPRLELPLHTTRWSGTELEVDPFFQGLLPLPHGAYRRYRRDGAAGPEVVELFATYEVADNRASRLLFSRKIRHLQRDWEVAQCQRVRLWSLDREAMACTALRPAEGQRALVYELRWRDHGFLIESLRSLLAWDRSPFAHSSPRLVMRLATPLEGDGDRARRTLARFVHDFSRALGRL
jgi:exosortase